MTCFLVVTAQTSAVMAEPANKNDDLEIMDTRSRIAFYYLEIEILNLVSTK